MLNLADETPTALDLSVRVAVQLLRRHAKLQGRDDRVDRVTFTHANRCLPRWRIPADPVSDSLPAGLTM